TLPDAEGVGLSGLGEVAEVQFAHNPTGVAVLGGPGVVEGEKVAVGSQGGEVGGAGSGVVRACGQDVLASLDLTAVGAFVGLALLVGPGGSGGPVADGRFAGH